MEFRTISHRFAQQIIQKTPELDEIYKEITDSIKSISDELLLERYVDIRNRRPKAKSLSYAINELLREKLHEERGWVKEAPIFQGDEYENEWRLDFLKATDVHGSEDDALSKEITKSGIAVEVAFNHGEAIAWNLMKPVLAAEINHIQKDNRVDLGSGLGVFICATSSLKDKGGFDGAVGEFEKVIRYLIPMRNQLTVPIMLIGLEAPSSFEIVRDARTRRSTGEVRTTL